MSKKKKRFQPKIKQEPPKRSIRIDKNPDSNRQKNPAWRIGLMDLEHERWGWNKVNKEDLKKILSKLKNFESMTWQEIYDASGGKNHGNESHNVSIENIKKDARKRLKELKIDDIDEIFSLRLTGKNRIWGILENNVLKIIWYDSDHEISKSKK
jgi:hypothetical protein